MEGDKFYEIREGLISLIKIFVDECKDVDVDPEIEISIILSEIMQDN